MLTLSVATVLSAAIFAADTKVAEVVAINQPEGWKLDIRDDGSANLRYITEPGSGYNAPAGTFAAEQVRKTLLALPSATKDESRRRAHYLIWFEAERKLAPEKEPPSHFTQNEALLVPLFEKAAEASGVKATPRGMQLLIEKPFRLPPEATRRKLFSLHTPSGWMLSICNDGSAQMVFGDGGGSNSFDAPVGTFQPEVVRKTLDGLKFDPKGSGGTHFVVRHEEMRQSPTEEPAARYSLDESVIVPLFEKAARARDKRPNNGVFEQFGRRRPAFGLGK